MANGSKVILTVGNDFISPVYRGKRVFFARGWDKDNPSHGAWFHLDPTPYKNKNDMIGRISWDIFTKYAQKYCVKEPGNFHPEKDYIPEKKVRQKKEVVVKEKKPKEPKKNLSFNPFAQEK